MIEKYGLFDSLEGDEREYAEADFARLCRAITGNGVRGGADALQVSAAASGLAVNVAPGLAVMEGRYYELVDDGSGAFTLSLSAATAHPRIDRIVLTLNYSARSVTLGVLKGTEAASPEAPALTRNASRTMLSLAQVRVPVGAGALEADNITDERADEDLCGLRVATPDSAMHAAQGAQAAVEIDIRSVQSFLLKILEHARPPGLPSILGAHDAAQKSGCSLPPQGSGLPSSVFSTSASPSYRSFSEKNGRSTASRRKKILSPSQMGRRQTSSFLTQASRPSSQSSGPASSPCQASAV